MMFNPGLVEKSIAAANPPGLIWLKRHGVRNVNR
jgi:hypothetical protein